MPNAYGDPSRTRPWQTLRCAPARPCLVPCPAVTRATPLRGQEGRGAGPGRPALCCLRARFRLLRQPGGKPTDNKALWKVPGSAGSSASGRKGRTNSLPAPGKSSTCPAPQRPQPCPLLLAAPETGCQEPQTRCPYPWQPLQSRPARTQQISESRGPDLTATPRRRSIAAALAGGSEQGRSRGARGFSWPCHPVSAGHTGETSPQEQGTGCWMLWLHPSHR